MDGEYDKLNRLALDTLKLSRNTLLVNLRFLDMALSMFENTPFVSSCSSVATDGKRLYYDPIKILKSFKNSRNKNTHDYLHTVFHCVFRHMFVGTIDTELWDLACDIAVESTVSELELKCIETVDSPIRLKEIGELKAKIGSLTAERIYRYLLDGKLSDAKIMALAELFHADDHSVWYISEGESGGEFFGAGDGKSSDVTEDGNKGNGSENEGDEGNENGSDGSPEQNDRSQDKKGSGNGQGSSERKALEKEWKSISERLQEEMETFEKSRGDTAGSLMQNLREINRERYDYTEFLKKFAVLTEVMKINDDEFDYVFYTYGLELYDRMPLIEPLEYKEDKRIKDFVIAIDTSGSVKGETVQTFVQKTYNVLKSAETFATKINLHILQCDTKIQEAVKITSQEEFDLYLKTMKLHGFGGTDFRPVFRYVDEMIEKKELTSLKGMIFFTDGHGIFPSVKPKYDTAFVFIDEDDYNREVPSWAIKLVLKKDEI